MAIKDLIKKGAARIPYDYVIGGKSTPSPIPFDVKLSIDPDLKKTLLKTGMYVGSGFAFLGICYLAGKKYIK